MKMNIPAFVVLVGVAILLAGLWQAWPPLTWVALGVIVIQAGAALGKRKEADEPQMSKFTKPKWN